MRNNRRDFLKKSVLAGLFLTMGGCNTSVEKTKKKIGFIAGGLLRDPLEKDWEGTLRKLAAMGYKYIESGSVFGGDPDYYRKFLEEVGLIGFNGSINMAGLLNENELKKKIDELLEWQRKYLICYWPWMDDGLNKQLDDFKIMAEQFNKAGQICRNNNIRLGMHNHEKEFVDVGDGKVGIEVFLEETDPDLVTVELDLYWCKFGNGDPIELIKKHPGRFEIYHVKDMDDTPERFFDCPGSGIIDFPEIFKYDDTSGVKYYIVEVDRNPDPIPCMDSSFKYLNGILNG
ncbi:sugar phosphate isomerase/epimerase family protein [Bacteroidota bacterium]